MRDGSPPRPTLERVPRAAAPSVSQKAAPAKVALRATRRAFAVEKATAASTPAIAIGGSSSDPGIKITIDPKTSRVLIRGVAEGPRVEYLTPVPGNVRRQVDYLYARGVGFHLDKEPDFSADPDCSRKNKWFLSHRASVDTQKGDSALDVAHQLAASLNEGGAYGATVIATANGAAIDVHRR
jgi:hypothetical protein